MSNLYKGQINRNKGDFYTRVIDHNELLEQKLSALSFEQEAKLRRERIAQARQAQGGGEGPEDAQGAFTEGLAGERIESDPEFEIDYVERAKEQAAQIVSKATADAEAILNKAVEEAENLKEDARKAAEAKGYAEGMERVRAQEAQMHEELRKLREEQEQAYAERLHAMEPELMDAVIKVFDQVLHSDLAGCREILLYLIRHTVQNIKNSREFRIRVSEQDYSAVQENREEILKKIGGDVVLDVMMDETVQPGQCTIDTDEGIFDCGLDVQLKNLIKDLRSLACMD